MNSSTLAGSMQVSHVDATLWYFHMPIVESLWVQLVICLFRCLYFLLHPACAPSSSPPAPVNLAAVLKQLEPQQMQMNVLGVKSKREEQTDRGVIDAEAARDTFTTAFKTNTCRRGPSAWGTSRLQPHDCD